MKNIFIYIIEAFIVLLLVSCSTLKITIPQDSPKNPTIDASGYVITYDNGKLAATPSSWLSPQFLTDLFNGFFNNIPTNTQKK